LIKRNTVSDMGLPSFGYFDNEFFTLITILQYNLYFHKPFSKEIVLVKLPRWPSDKSTCSKFGKMQIPSDHIKNLKKCYSLYWNTEFKWDNTWTSGPSVCNVFWVRYLYLSIPWYFVEIAHT